MMFRLKISAADKFFSLYIRNRAKWTCERCFKKFSPPTTDLHCSHFHGRAKKSVRWDEDNASALCYGCHVYFTSHPLAHVDFFKKRLGERRFDLLTVRANTILKMDQKIMAIYWKSVLKEQGWA